MHHINRMVYATHAWASLVPRQQKVSDFRGLGMRLEICTFAEMERHRM